MDFELINGIVAVPIIIGLIEVLKRVLGMDAKLAPVVAVVLGLAASFGVTYFGETEAFEAVVLGLAVGLSAVGLYSGSKNVNELRK
jgi:hypothetical protein